MKSNRMMNRMLNAAMVPDLDDELVASTASASCPVRWKVSPAGGRAVPKSARTAFTTVVACALKADPEVAMTTSRALPSLESPRSRTRDTPVIPLTDFSSRLMAAASALVSGPEARTATSTAVEPGFFPSKDAARFAALTLGVLADRNCELSDRMTLESVGRSLTAAGTAISHTMRIRYRYLTSKRPMALNTAVSPLGFQGVSAELRRGRSA